VWVEEQAGYPLLYYSFRIGGNWSTPQALFVGEEPDLVATANGQFHLVYSNEFSDNYEIFYSCWVNGHWQPPVNVSYTRRGTSSQPAITASPDGKLFIVWTDTTEGFPRIYHAWQENGMWNTYLVPSSVGGSSPDIAIGKDGRVWVTWQVLEEPADTGHYDIYAIYGDGIHWASFAMNVSESTEADSLAAKIAGDTHRGAFLVWQEDEGQHSHIYYADTLLYKDWWSIGERISQGGTQAEQPAITVDGAGNVYVAWEEGTELLFRRRLASSGEWLPSSTLAQASGLEAVALAHDTFVLHAAWTQTKPDLGTKTSQRDVYYRHGQMIWPYHLWTPLVFAP
ncbi:MAG: hypothetical protein J7M05_02295, partial [Anaerolineae bacterium]|nr:hypothetical protein [Anaerolineae bacterium]